MKLQWDFSEFTKFANKLEDKHKFESTIMTATQKVARVLHQRLLEQTPIDTGNLRKMWSAGDNLKFTVRNVANGYEVTFINTARVDNANGFMYGLAVNDGHKTPDGAGWVMGRFFVEKSILLTEQKAEQIIMNELKKWWDSV
jgi:hypothetical protein